MICTVYLEVQPPLILHSTITYLHTWHHFCFRRPDHRLINKSYTSYNEQFDGQGPRNDFFLGEAHWFFPFENATFLKKL